MTQPQDPRKHPLQDDEVALARVLRALPSGEPPASVDDAILRAATDAVSPSRRKPARALRWLPTWAVGTAAAAVLAVGIGIQLRPPLAPQYPAAGVEEKTPVRPEARERLSVDLVAPEPAPTLPPASAPPAPGPSRSAPVPPPPPPPVPMAPPPPVLEPVPQAMPAEAAAAELAAPLSQESDQLDTIEVTGSRIRSEATDQARRVHQESYARRAQAKAAAEASSRQEMAERESESAALGANEALPQASFTAPAPPAGAAPAASAMADAAAESEILPPVADDAKLTPDAWIERIRERRRQGDSAGARASLRLFLKAYPEAPIPSDLARLR